MPTEFTKPESDIRDETREEIALCVLPMIESLPEHCRQALMLSEIKGMAQKEVAASEGLSLSGAKARVQRGRAMLKKTLLACCDFEFDRKGNVIDYDGKNGGCHDCGNNCG